MPNPPNIHLVVGARPNYMKAKRLLELLPPSTLIHTGQEGQPGGYTRATIHTARADK